MDYAPDSFESEEHGTGEYGDSADSGRYGVLRAGGGAGVKNEASDEDRDVAEAISYMASLPECVFKSDLATACLVQSWLPVLVPGRGDWNIACTIGSLPKSKSKFFHGLSASVRLSHTHLRRRA